MPDDLIKRQAAIDAVNELTKWYYETYREKRPTTIAVIDKLMDLPSAQPEIIRCEECKHSEHWYGDKSRCFLWAENGIDVFDGGFCNYAERREDETD